MSQIVLPRKKFKIVTKESRCKDFRMFDFRTLDIEKHDSPGQKSFRIQMFGINEIGETCALFVDDFQPFFYVKLPPNWRVQDVDQWFNETKKSCGKYYEKDCLSVHMEKHCKLYEFTADTSYDFAKCVFRNMRAFNQFKKKVMNNKKMPTYESKIPPLLRYFHIHHISPSGWIQICIHDMESTPETWTSCTYEYMCSVADIKPLKDKETPVPYKIASVDIEASSSHGDFPLPVKDYKRMATQVIDVLDKKMIRQTMLTVDAVNSYLKKSILSVFSIGSSIDGIDVVFPKETPNKEDVKALAKLILEQKIDLMDNKDSPILKISEMFASMATHGNGSEEANGDTNNKDFVVNDSETKSYHTYKHKLTPQQKTLTMAEYLIHPDHTREMKIQTFNTAMTNLFPPLDGDRVTFIGTTFLKFGQKEPYKNHCLVVGTCDPVDGVEICTVTSERECLVDWTQLIQDENPRRESGYHNRI